MLKEDAEVRGIVKNITDYGVFVDLGGIDGLLHVTDLSWGRVNHPSEMFNVGDEITVKILKYDRDKERVSLGYKQLTPDPWTLVQQVYPVGARVTGKVVNLTDYGAFLTRAGDKVRGRKLLSEALHVAETCGAGWHAHRARMEWRRAGGRTRSREPTQLTPPETAVAQLAQVGKTNRQIAQQLHMSVKTVETHLGHIYQKLGIRSRWQLGERNFDAAE